mmetsp:Transcript_27933/g.43911  ORF Transcript_27933/g.43911 Transcript_27933/m.43911 type:complete len:199 (+) Transcript_27933:47-643(+)
MLQLAFFLLALIEASHYVNVASFSSPKIIAARHVHTISNVHKAEADHYAELQSMYRRQRSRVYMGESDDDLSDVNSFDNIVGSAGAVSQPVVWLSLYFVATTGGGLPAGPFGLFGAVEGLAYLSVVGLVIRSIFFRDKASGILGTAENLSLLTLGASLLVLASLVAQQGCIPNAKPLLDYSNYVKVCNPEEVPGLFGG